MFLEYVINVQSLFILSFLLCVGLLYFKNKIYFFCGVGLIIFLWIPYIFDQLFVGRIVTNIDDSKEWFSFLSGYLGSGFGAIATLSGIFYQLNYTRKLEEKNRLEGLILYLKYSLEDISQSEIFIMDIEYNNFYNEGTKSFFQISENFLRDNIKLLFSLDENIAKEILDFFLEVFHFNSNCLRLSKIEKESLILEDIIINLKKETKELNKELNKELINTFLRIKNIFNSLDSILAQKFIFNENKDNPEIQIRVIKSTKNFIIDSLKKDIEIIEKMEYIKKRRVIKTFLDNNLKKIKSSDFEKEIFNENLKEENLFNILTNIKNELILNVITAEEIEILKYDSGINLVNKIKILKTRLFLEKQIIKDKIETKENAQKLIYKIKNKK